MHIMSALVSLFAQAPAWVSALSGVVAAASAITALTPSPKDDKILGLVRQVLEVLALNVGHAAPTSRQQ